jgi:hypothetical protein
VQDRVRIAARLCEELAHVDAERLLRHIVAEHPCDGAAWQFLGDVLRELGRFEEAAAVYRLRKAIYRHSVGRWRPDDQVLAPLLDGLAGADSGSSRQGTIAPSSVEPA